MRGGLTIIAAVLVTACAGITGPTSTASAPTTVPATSPTSTLPPVVDCPGVGEFVEAGGVADIDGEGSDSTRLGRISWASTDQCESFDFEFETSEGAPATMVPDVQIEYLDSLQVIRLDLGVGSASLVDQLVETVLVDRLFVVRGLDGDLFVDLHLALPAAARARVTTEPARLTVDLRPGFLEFGGVATGNDRIVAVVPTNGAEVDATTTLSGYARTFESNVEIEVSQDDAVLLETFATAADSAETWGEFQIELELPPGEVRVTLSETGAEDGTTTSITLDLAVR